MAKNRFFITIWIFLTLSLVAWFSPAGVGAYSTDKSAFILCGAVIGGDIPTTPFLLDPGEADTDGNFIVQWLEASSGVGIASYELQEDITTSFSNSSVFNTQENELSYNFLNHADGHFYYRVRAFDVDGLSSDWSNIVDIIVDKSAQNFNYISFEAEEMHNPYFKKGEEKEISVADYNQNSPAIYDGKIVWVDERDKFISNSDIYFYDLIKNEEKPICTDIYEQKNPVVSGNWIVWEDYRNNEADIYMYDLTTGEEKPVCVEPGGQVHPAVSGDKIVWEDYRNIDADIYMYDLATGVEKAICVDIDDQINPSISDDKIVWQDYRDGGSDIYMFDFAKNKEMPICADISDQECPKIFGDKIVWIDWRNADVSGADIYMYDLSENKEIALCAEPLDQNYPSISGNKIIWVDEDLFFNNLHVYDLATKEDVILKEGISWSSTPQISNDKIAWDDGPSGNKDIYLASLVPYSSIIYDNSSGAWAGAYILSGTNPDYPYSHKFSVPRDGDYAVWVRLSEEADSSDEVALSLNGGGNIVVGNETGNNSPNFRWINFRDGDPQKRIILHLLRGENLIELKDIEPSTKVDSVIITDNLSYIPPDTPPSVKSWEGVVQNGFGDSKNFSSRMKIFRDSLFISTSNANYHPAIYKTDDGINFAKVFDLKVPYKDGFYMYRTLDIDAFKGKNLYVVSDNYWGGLHITGTSDGANFTTNLVGNRGWWTKDIVEFNDLLYAGFYNDEWFYFTMRRTLDPMVNSLWKDVSNPTFSSYFNVVRKNIGGKIVEKIIYSLYGNVFTESSCIFKGKLYIGTYNYGYLGRATEGAQIWRSADGTNWEGVMLDGFGDKNNRSITAMAPFGGYLYAAVNKGVEPCRIFRTDGAYHNGKMVWESVVTDGFGRRYNSYVSAFYPYMGRLYALTSGWLYPKDIPKEEYSGGKVYATDSGLTWNVVSENGILDLDNVTLENIESYRGFLYINTQNSTTGTQVIKGKVE